MSGNVNQYSNEELAEGFKRILIIRGQWDRRNKEYRTLIKFNENISSLYNNMEREEFLNLNLKGIGKSTKLVLESILSLGIDEAKQEAILEKEREVKNIVLEPLGTSSPRKFRNPIY